MILRPAVPGDEEHLWAMLFEAAHAADGGMAGPAGLREVPELARYVEGWGRPTDLGVVATEDDGTPIGAAWVRLLVGDDAGYGYVDDATPELAIAVAPGTTGRGVGTAMLTRLLDVAAEAFPAVCLSVRAGSPARRLYERLGFRLVDDRDRLTRSGSTSVTMVLRFGSNP